MANNLLFSLFFSILQLIAAPIFAPDDLKSSDEKSLTSDDCSAPAPDSFRVTTEGVHFVSLAWHPMWVGATHTLTQLKKVVGTEAWVPVDTFLNIPGGSFTVTNLEYGSKYRFVIATNCSSVYFAQT
jgi:hypothetical protein